MARLFRALSVLSVPFAIVACGGKSSPSEPGDAGGETSGSCTPAECGPNGLGAPAPCPDGTIPGDICARNGSGACSWSSGSCAPQKPCHSSAECGASAYCNSPSSSCLGSGVCAPKPNGCGLDFSPVCGCDGKTYGNACAAAMAGMVVATVGECAGTKCTSLGTFACGSGSYCQFSEGTCPTELPPAVDGVCAPLTTGCGKNLEPVCGCNGVTYSNPCLAAAGGTNLLHHGSCETPDPPTSGSCGGIAGIKCSSKEWCDFGTSASCGRDDSMGTCKPRPSACDPIRATVCGCDGKIYDNACYAEMAGFGVGSGCK